MTSPLDNLDPALLHFRVLRQDAQGQWWAVWGDGCAEGATPPKREERAELLWAATGLETSIMRLRAEAVRHEYAAYFPMHYPQATLDTLKSGRPPSRFLPRRKQALQLGYSHPEQWAGCSPFHTAHTRAQRADWCASGAWKKWMRAAETGAQDAQAVWGPGALPFCTAGDAAPPSAHLLLAARTKAQTLLPIGPKTCRLWIGTT